MRYKHNLLFFCGTLIVIVRDKLKNCGDYCSLKVRRGREESTAGLKSKIEKEMDQEKL